VPADQSQTPTPGLSFGAMARAYERARPSYPKETVDWLLPVGARRVLDLGAGTGKLTRALLSRGLQVVAVEPSLGMREVLVEAAPGATVIAGSAEDIPLGDASVDAVLVAQAWHWVDQSRAIPEVARVLRPGGLLGLVWNTRDESEPWVAALSTILAQYGATEDFLLDPRLGPPFGPLARHYVRWDDPMTISGIVDLCASRSYLAILTSADRAVALDQIRVLLETHPDVAGRDEISLPYVTQAFRAERTRNLQVGGGTWSTPARPW